MNMMYSSETPVISTVLQDTTSQNTVLFIKVYVQRKSHKIENGATYNKVYRIQ
jgi:hypothetical protein